MDTALQNAIQQLLATASQAIHAPVQAAIRYGRFVGLSDRDFAETTIPASALDALDSPAVASLCGQELAKLPELLSANDLTLFPVRGEAGNTIALLCVAQVDLRENMHRIAESFAQTFAVLFETLDSASTNRITLLHDPLTHLPSRAMFDQRLSVEVEAAHRSSARVAVFTIDLDNFSAINDQHGRAVGDRVLQKIASRLHHAVRRSDTPARLSDDKFAVIGVTMSDQPEGTHVAGRLIKVLSQPMEIDGVTINPTASVGIAVYPIDGLSADALLQNSLAAMHRAKIRGQNNFEYFTPQLHADAMERLELESRLRVAVEKNQLVLHYQPIVDREGKISGVEALVRWKHPELGLIPPGKFIPIAEQTGLILPIGTWVLTEAAQQAAQWAIEGMAFRMNVNVSTLQFAQDDYVSIVASTLEKTAVDPKQLELEVTEGVFATESAEIVAKFGRLRALGVRVAIDDFGAGYSSLSRVHSLPIDTLKIDRAFINEITVKDAATPLHHRTAVLRAMATLGHSLGLRLVAEGVETRDQAAFLRRIGYDAMQGYLYSKPVTAEQIPDLVKRLGLSGESAAAAIAA
ncbi:MAG: bifunctional diguanylate cyclase/phosphodiesterase [Burkholderiales bacterium]|nr:bifunctional diguanylate cyclase/phosphodiesterase [Phycisphaerae bacterium]